MRVDVTAGELHWREVYKLCISFITPRPIALVSTLSVDGARNLAPFSFYNMVSARPAVVMISVGTPREKRAKDTLRNIRDTGEFAIATVSSAIAPQMVRCGAELPSGQSEFEFSGLTPTPATKIKPALVAESPVNIECRLRQIVPLGDEPGAGNLILGDVLMIHAQDDVLDADRLVDAEKLRAVGRLGGKWYANVADPYQMTIPEAEEHPAKREA